MNAARTSKPVCESQHETSELMMPHHANNLGHVFGGVMLCFMAAHLFFLWVLFSGDWPHHVTGPISFVREFVIASGASTRSETIS